MLKGLQYVTLVNSNVFPVRRPSDISLVQQWHLGQPGVIRLCLMQDYVHGHSSLLMDLASLAALSVTATGWQGICHSTK